MSAFPVPTLTGQPTAAVGEMLVMGAINLLRVPFTVAATGSYDTGGSAVTLPPGTQGKKLVGINIFNHLNTALSRFYVWNGDKAAPKIVALTALPGTQVAGATNLSGDTLVGEFVFEG